jgi:hypothetical protein
MKKREAKKMRRWEDGKKSGSYVLRRFSTYKKGGPEDNRF